MDKLYYNCLTKGCALDIKPLSYCITKLFDHFIGDVNVQLYAVIYKEKQTDERVGILLSCIKKQTCMTLFFQCG